MRVAGLPPVHRTYQRELAEGVVEMVVAANDVRHSHVVVVDDDSEHIGRRAVAPQQDEIVEFGILDGDLALDLVGDRYRAVLRRAQADDVRERGIAVAAVAPLADLMTDKATVEISAPVSGRILKTAGKVGRS